MVGCKGLCTSTGGLSIRYIFTIHAVEGCLNSGSTNTAADHSELHCSEPLNEGLSKSILFSLVSLPFDIQDVGYRYEIKCKRNTNSAKKDIEKLS